MRQMKDSGIEWIGEIPDTWKLCKGRYLFKQRNLRGNNIEMQLLSPTQNSELFHRENMKNLVE